MKKNIIVFISVFLIMGCKMNPSKESRIQKLETEIQLVTNKISELEKKVQKLEVANQQFKTRVNELEKG